MLTSTDGAAESTADDTQEPCGTQEPDRFTAMKRFAMVQILRARGFDMEDARDEEKVRGELRASDAAIIANGGDPLAMMKYEKKPEKSLRVWLFYDVVFLFVLFYDVVFVFCVGPNLSFVKVGTNAPLCSFAPAW